MFKSPEAPDRVILQSAQRSHSGWQGPPISQNGSFLHGFVRWFHYLLLFVLSLTKPRCINTCRSYERLPQSGEGQNIPHENSVFSMAYLQPLPHSPSWAWTQNSIRCPRWGRPPTIHQPYSSYWCSLKDKTNDFGPPFGHRKARVATKHQSALKLLYLLSMWC